jgi:hypothetical protein
MARSRRAAGAGNLRSARREDGAGRAWSDELEQEGAPAMARELGEHEAVRRPWEVGGQAEGAARGRSPSSVWA